MSHYLISFSLQIDGMNSKNFEIFHKKEIFDEFPYVVVLLHGKRFSSKTWEDIGTTKFLSDQKISWLTIDLPGMTFKILLIKIVPNIFLNNFNPYPTLNDYKNFDITI